MSETYKVIILPEAQKDIQEIIIYIAKELYAVQAALELHTEFYKAINSLSSMPKRINLVSSQPWKNIGVRRIQVKNYYIYFLVDDENLTVKVNAVIYMGRKQSKYLKKMSE